MTTMKRVRSALATILCSWLLLAVLHAQTAPRFVGSITAIDKSTLTVKTDTGEQRTFDVPTSAVLKRIAPGERDLSKAATIEFGELAVGDRVLVKIDTTAQASTPQAAQIIAVKQADLAQKQQKDREDWQRRGAAGLVKSVDAGAGTILLSSGAGANTKTVTVKTTPATVLKRYAPGSVRFDDAKAAPLTEIHPGDQLRARGNKSDDGAEITAEEIVSGSFRNIAGTISSIDTASNSMVVKDLATKKQVTVKITPDAQMKRLPERMAQALAARLKSGAGGAQGGGQMQAAAGRPGAGGPGASGPPSGAPAAEGSQQHAHNGGPGGAGPDAGPDAAQGAGTGAMNGQGGPAGGGDPQQMLSRAPSIQLSELQKGEAVMLVSTEGANDVSVVSLLAGVEPLLESPAASQNLLSNWSMGGGGGGEAGGGPQ